MFYCYCIYLVINFVNYLFICFVFLLQVHLVSVNVTNIILIWVSTLPSPPHPRRCFCNLASQHCKKMLYDNSTKWPMKCKWFIVLPLRSTVNPRNLLKWLFFFQAVAPRTSDYGIMNLWPYDKWIFSDMMLPSLFASLVSHLARDNSRYVTKFW